ncbi:hypothetical protein CK623_02980 [Vandammella animalimorsus]|uniref:Uncharacterized protein n=2 Tax=Vandammella animalimorsus TaxID=2029117 RepID=A0A2A2AU87_9BURK|nr:hypothetical protein CK623_02980 [Vandammella animalimorsus]
MGMLNLMKLVFCCVVLAAVSAAYGLGLPFWLLLGGAFAALCLYTAWQFVGALRPRQARWRGVRG